MHLNCIKHPINHRVPNNKKNILQINYIYDLEADSKLLESNNKYNDATSPLSIIFTFPPADGASYNNTLDALIIRHGYQFPQYCHIPSPQSYRTA